MRNEWIVRLLFDRYRVRVKNLPDSAQSAMRPVYQDSPILVAQLVQLSRDDPELQRQLEEIYASLGGYLRGEALGGLGWFSPEPGVLTEMGRFLESQARLGLLHVERLPHPKFSHAPEEKIIDLSRLPVPPAPSKAEEKEIPTWFEVTLADELGEPIDGIEVTFSHGGVREKIPTDVSGVARWEQTVATSFASVSVMDVSMLRETLEKRWTLRREGAALTAKDGVDIIHLRTGESLLVTVARETPKIISIQPIPPAIFAFVVPDENFRLERSIWLPTHDDPTPDPEPASAKPAGLRPGLALAAAVWGYARQQPKRQIAVAGHTDKSGSTAFNESLSRRRAEQVHLYLAGEHEAWADHAQQYAQVDDLQAVLLWASQAFEIDTDPGAIDDDWGPLTRGALHRFRGWYETSLGLSPPEGDGAGQTDWLAVSHCYDLAIGRALEWTEEDLAEARGRLQWHPSYPVLACGESWPARSPGTGSVAEDRRVEVLFVDAEACPPDAGSPEGSTLYDDPRYQWHWLEADELWLELGAPIRNDVHLRLLSNSGRHHLSNCEVELETPSATHRVTTDGQGFLLVPKVEPGYHPLRVSYGDRVYETRVPSVAIGTGPYLHRVPGARRH